MSVTPYNSLRVPETSNRYYGVFSIRHYVDICCIWLIRVANW